MEKYAFIMCARRILIVDDEENLCEILQFNLIAAGYEADTAYSAEEALRMDICSYDLILLDVMMGAVSGFEMARILKSDPRTASVPIIFCTAKDTEEDVVSGLDGGADDYIAKPFSVREVVARVSSVLRRVPDAGQDTETEVLRFEGLLVDIAGKCCMLDGVPVPLTRTELEILAFFLRNRGRVFTREEILERVWPDEVIVLGRTIDVNITRLRRKIHPYGKHIITRTGYGYGFEA